MQELKVKSENSNVKIDKFEERLKNRFSVEGNSLLGNNVEFSNLFEKNNSLSDSFSVLKIKQNRAIMHSQFISNTAKYRC